MKDSLDVNEWIRFAQMDYDVAKNMSIMFHPIPLEIVCYHCQQSAEKVLKAYAIAQGEPLIKTHDLKVIITQCVKYDESFNHYAKHCAILTPYALISRYPINEDAVNEQDMKTALENAFVILEFTKIQIAKLPCDPKEKP
jgi:HEPN domain-containing protein